MSDLRDSKCHCLRTSTGCNAFWETEQIPKRDSMISSGENEVSFWCKIDPAIEKLCKVNKKPKIKDLKKMKSGDMLWSQDICRKKPKPKKGRDPPEGRCKCMKGAGYRPMGPRKARVDRKYMDQVQQGESVMIGHRCNKWFTGDKEPWCVVGFDTACADRQPLVIDSSRNLKVWKSPLPCLADANLDIV